MRTIFYLTFIFIFWGCHSKRTPPSQVGDVIFRTSYNYDTARGRQYLGIQSPDQTFKIDLGMTLLGDRWITLIDLDDDGVKEMLILDKYYVMNGDNFELKFYTL